MQLLLVLFLLGFITPAMADDHRPWAGPAVELRYGGGVTDFSFSGQAEGEAGSLSFGDAMTMQGLKVGWRFPLGQRFTFGPMLALYEGGVSAGAAGEYLPEAIAGRLRYREGMSLTAGLQLGVDLGRGWFTYLEGGYVGQEASLDGAGTWTDGVDNFSDQGYLVGKYAAVGLLKQLGPQWHLALEYQERRYEYQDWDGDSSGLATRKDSLVFLGVGMQF